MNRFPENRDIPIFFYAWFMFIAGLMVSVLGFLGWVIYKVLVHFAII